MRHRRQQAGGGAALVLSRRREARVNFALTFLAIAGLSLWSSWGIGFDIPKLFSGISNIYDLASRMLPPDTKILPRLVKPMLETLQMALLGTTIPIFLALPLALLAAANTGPHRLIIIAARLLLNTLRTVPELVWAMLLVSAVGLGTFPGVLALSLHATGGLGKFYAEAIEAVNPGVIEAVEATGASRFKVIWFGILPSCLPVMMSTTLWYWEVNNRSATVLGLVGAGGIGLAFTHAIQDFQYRVAITCLILIVLILTVIDRISAALRARVI